MTEKILEKLVRYIYLPKFRKLEHEIGYKLIFRNIPSYFINGWVNCDMTKTWQSFGLDVKKGANYFTMGSLLDGESSRFERDSIEYESWFGAYTLKLASKSTWSAKDHFKLAIADQNSWLRWYADPKPSTTVEGWEFTEIDRINLGRYSGTLYDFGCTTHSDVGSGYKTIKLRLACAWMAALFNISNPNLKLRGNELRPRTPGKSYEKLKLHGYIAIFDLPENVKVVLYGNGFIDKEKHIDTFEVLRGKLLKAMKSCDIVTA
jgi:hypothetical protein